MSVWQNEAYEDSSLQVLAQPVQYAYVYDVPVSQVLDVGPQDDAPRANAENGAEKDDTATEADEETLQDEDVRVYANAREHAPVCCCVAGLALEHASISLPPLLQPF